MEQYTYFNVSGRGKSLLYSVGRLGTLTRNTFYFPNLSVIFYINGTLREFFKHKIVAIKAPQAVRKCRSLFIKKCLYIIFIVNTTIFHSSFI